DGNGAGALPLSEVFEEAELHHLQTDQAKADGKYPNEKQRGKDVKPSTWRPGSAGPHSLFTPFRCALLRRRRSSKIVSATGALHAEGGPSLADRRFASTLPDSAGFVWCLGPASFQGCAEITVIPLACAMTGVEGSAIAESIGCSCPPAGRCMPICLASLSMRAGSFNEASSRLSARFDSVMLLRCTVNCSMR